MAISTHSPTLDRATHHGHPVPAAEASTVATSTVATAATPPTDTRHRALRLLQRIGRAVVEAASLPSHPYLTSVIGPHGAVVWTARLAQRTSQQQPR